MNRLIKSCLRLCIVLLISRLAAGEPAITASAQPDVSSVQTPILKWAYKGCYSSWCETGWYSSPAVADLDGDGQVEVVGSAYSIVSLDGATGALEWRVASGADRSNPSASSVGRTWPGIVIADVDGDGQWEIVTAHSGGVVSVYNASGYFEAGWPKHPTSSELRGLTVYDLDGDHTAEIIVTGAIGSRTNTWVYEHNGALRSGWPQLSNDSGYAWGVFNDNSAAGDLNGDGRAEIVVPSDVHYINAYTDYGVQIPANSMYGGKGWGLVGAWESPEIELRGWGECDGVRSESYRANFAAGTSLIEDLDGDGRAEVAAVGNVYNCISGYPSQYYGLYLFNPDRSRFHQGSYNWSYPTLDTGAPIVPASDDYASYDIIEDAQPNLVAADLDGDGKQEILFPSYDGRLHAFWLDHSEHGSWPFIANPSGESGYHYASEPVVADLDGDGQAEVILTTWGQKGSNQTGRLVILNSQGQVLQNVALPAAKGSADWNGGLPAPTLANLDSDTDLEVVVNTSASGMVAYDLPGTGAARIYWGTGRGNSLRSGSLIPDSLAASTFSADPTGWSAGESIPMTLTVRSGYSDWMSARMQFTLSPDLALSGSPVIETAGQVGGIGSLETTSGVITWNGMLSGDAPVRIHFNVTPTHPIGGPQALSSTWTLWDDRGPTLQREATIILNGYLNALPLISR